MASKTLPQYCAALSATGGAFAAGTMLGWTSPVQDEILSEGGHYSWAVSAEEFSWIGALATLGAACVCIPIGIFISWIGRKPSMLLLVLPFTFGWSMLIFATNTYMLYIGRFALGLAGGAFCVTAPIYTGEIAQNDIRGTLGSFFQLMISSGILFVYVLGAIWQAYTITIICAIIPLIFGIIFLFMPESPLYLVQNGKLDKAIESLQWLRGKDYNYKAEMDEMIATELQQHKQSQSKWQSFKRPESIKAMSISLGLMSFQQLGGINVIIFYDASIFRSAHTSLDANISAIIVGSIQVFATLLSVVLVDKVGRKPLLIASGLMLSLSTLCLGIYFFMEERDPESVTSIGWVPVVCLCIYIMFSIGFGPVPWIMIGELFASDIKTTAGSISATYNWLLAFIVTKCYVSLENALGVAQTFWLFSIINMFGALFSYFVVIETKGKSLKEVQDMLKDEE